MKNTWISPFTWLMRIVVGCTFAYSGFVKAIDPWGTLYKFQDYMGALGLPDYPNLLLVAVFLLCAYEFATGIFLLTGCFRRSSPIASLLLMVVMLPLTLWIAVADPVDDCGCFGDALVISNWATFWKNVVLTSAIIWLVRFNATCRSMIRPFIQWIAFILTIGFNVIIGLAGYIYQPLLDFRPYPVGTMMSDGSIAATGSSSADDSAAGASGSQEDSYDGEGSEADGMIFIYVKDGVEKSFSIHDELPDESEGWTFVRRESFIQKNGVAAKGGGTSLSDAGEKGSDGFRIWSEDGNEDITEKVVRSEGGQLFLLMPDLRNVSMATTWQINSLYNWAQESNIDMIGIVAAAPADIERWKDLSLASYPLYTAEDTQIEMLARGNPAVVYLNNGRIVWKSSLRALGTEDFQSASASGDPVSYARDDHAMLMNASGFYILAMVILMFLSYLPSLGRFFPGKVRDRIERRDARISAKESTYHTLGKRNPSNESEAQADAKTPFRKRS